MPNSYEMKRTNSICPKPEEQLLELVKYNEIFKIKDLVRQHPNIVEKIYGHPYYKPILSIAVSNFAEFVNAQTLETLLEVGANAFAQTDMFQNKTAIHHAATSHNEQALKVLIEHSKLIQPEYIDLTAEGDTPLLALIKECEDVSKPVVNCVKILLENGCDFNKSDANDRSPILHAARKGLKEIVQLLIEQPDIDIDSHYLRKKNARNFIIEKSLINEEDLPDNNKNNNSSSQSDSGEAFRLLKSSKELEFLEYDNVKGMMDSDDGSETPLQICARLNLHKAAKHLVNLGADTNRITARKRETPLEICAKLGHHKVFEVLLDCEYTKLNNVLSDIIKYSDSFKTERINHQRCFELLLEKKSLTGVLNQKNSEGNTPLHYAARYSRPNTTLLLLNKGASLGDANNHGFLPIEDIEPELLKEHFNNCINTSSEKIDEGDFTVTFDYKTILPSELQEDALNKIKINKITNDDYTTPILTQKIERNKNNNARKPISEMKVIKYMAKMKELRPLLIHPLITSFLYLKWHRISGLFYANLVLYIAIWFSLTTWIFMAYNNPNYEQETAGLKAFSVILHAIIWLSSLLLTIKELFQFIVSPLRYLKQMENYIEVALITSIFLILFVKQPQDDFKKQISAIAILVSAFQLVLLVGQHPKMSTSIVMLRTVSFSFFKFFLWYAILILAFALSFYTLFNNNNSSSIAVENIDKDKTELKEDAFKDAGVSLFKTFVMLTGEFDASDIDFKTFPITSRILFVVFIFMIAIVLFNLLNGLAVSDTQLIKNNAELFAYISRIEHICYVENMLLGNLASLPDGILKFFQRICCLCPGCNNINVTLPKILAQRASLFPHYLCNLQLEIYLNKSGCVKLPLEREKRCVRIDKMTVKNVRTLLKERNKINPNEVALQELLTKINQQQSRIEQLNLKTDRKPSSKKLTKSFKDYKKNIL